ncbi:MAG: hypothetical protein ACRDRX_01495 [Pseudonocardiaceae bacterium]
MTGIEAHAGPASGPGAAAGPVVLVRYRHGVVGETARSVHLVPLSTGVRASAVRALCGTVLMLAEMDTVTPGEGMPCTACVLDRMSVVAAEEEPLSGSAEDDVQEWNWPVTLHHGQLRLRLGDEVSAHAIPVRLGVDVTRILRRRRCAPAVLAHPYAPDHRIVLTGEKYEVALPWPAGVHRVTGVLLLPPTGTPRGPITWTQSPRADSLQRCREIDLFGALRTALSDSSHDGHACSPTTPPH